MLACQFVNTQLNAKAREIGAFSVSKETNLIARIEHPAADLPATGVFDRACAARSQISGSRGRISRIERLGALRG